MVLSKAIRYVGITNILQFLTVWVLYHPELLGGFETSWMEGNTMFIVILTLLLIDLFANINFLLQSYITLQYSPKVLLWSSCGFFLVSLIFRIEIVSYFVNESFVYLPFQLLPIVQLSSVLFGLSLVMISQQSVAYGFQKALLWLGGINIGISAISYIVSQLAVLELHSSGLFSSIISPFLVLNFYKHLFLPIISAIVFIDWSYRFENHPQLNRQAIV